MLLAKIIVDDRVSRQQDPGPPAETDVKAQAMLPLVRSIPTERLYECYVLAMEAREAGNTFLVSGVELLQAWKGLGARLEAESKREAARAEADESHLPDCGYCENERLAEKYFPKNDSRAMLPCDRCRPKAFAVAVAQWKERNPVVDSAGSIAAVVEAGKKILGVTLKCSSCAREVNTYMTRFKAGDKCGHLLNRYVSDANDEGEPKLCDGILEQVPAH